MWRQGESNMLVDSKGRVGSKERRREGECKASGGDGEDDAEDDAADGGKCSGPRTRRSYREIFAARRSALATRTMAARSRLGHSLRSRLAARTRAPPWRARCPLQRALLRVLLMASAARGRHARHSPRRSPLARGRRRQRGARGRPWRRVRRGWRSRGPRCGRRCRHSRRHSCRGG